MQSKLPHHLVYVTSALQAQQGKCSMYSGGSLPRRNLGHADLSCSAGSFYYIVSKRSMKKTKGNRTLGKYDRYRLAFRD